MERKNILSLFSFFFEEDGKKKKGVRSPCVFTRSVRDVLVAQ